MSSYGKRLANLKRSWDTDKPVSSQGQLPAGKYQFEIKRALLGESKANFNKGNVQVELYCSVITGPLKGCKHIIRIDLEAKAGKSKGGYDFPSGISRFKGTLETLKVDMPKQLDDNGINKTLKQLIGIVFDGACVHNDKGYANVYINGLVNAPESEDEDEEVDEEEENEEESEESEDEESDDEEDEEESEEEEEVEEESEEEEEVEEKPAKKAAPATKTPPAKPAKAEKNAKPAKAEKPAKEDKEEDDDWSDDEFDDK